jgi:hypothetical protein
MHTVIAPMLSNGDHTVLVQYSIAGKDHPSLRVITGIYAAKWRWFELKCDFFLTERMRLS